MRYSKVLAFCFIIVILGNSVYLQAQQFDSVFSKLNNEYKQEKLYLHFDRSLYTPGETIWFKAYLFTDNYPSQLSKTIYTELVDESGKVLQFKSAPVLSSSAAGDFDIPANFSGSVIYVRAYTKWMLNFDSSYIYTKAIPLTTFKKTGKELSAFTTITFFPEGGDLVQDVKSRIAFKAVNNFGIPVNVTGDIINKSGQKIISFTSAHDGMGTFNLEPKAGETYKAIWKDETGKTAETILPTAKVTGVVLEVNNNSLQVEFNVKRSPSVSPTYPFVYVVVQMNQKLLFKAKANIAKAASVPGIIPSDNLPAGIVQVSLFTPDEKPIAERITFINNTGSSFITDINTTVKELNKRKKNIIQIDVPDTIGANLSISITDADLNNYKQPENIFSNVLLTSDLKGYIYNPAYYFSSDADSVADHLDLVMMTNGWRRFNWENVIANKWPKIIYRPEPYLSIDGQVIGLNKTLLYNKELNGIIELKNKKRDFTNALVQPDGKFVFPEMVFYDSARFFYQFNNDKKKALTSRGTFIFGTTFLKKSLSIKPAPSPLGTYSKDDSVILTKNIKVYNDKLKAGEFEKVKTLKEVVVTAKQKTKEELMDEQYTSGLFTGGLSKTFLPEDDPALLSSQSVLDYLKSRVAGLEIFTGESPSISWRGSPTALFMNEMEQEIVDIINIPMSEIAMIKVFNPPFFGASRAGAGGAVAVYLKTGSGFQKLKGLDFLPVSGYSPVKEFYSPDYSQTDAPTSADLRKTLYWQPFVVTDKNNRRVIIPFYNNDFTKKIKIIIEGCNADGKLTRVEKIIQ